MGSIRTNLFPVEFECRFLSSMGRAFRRCSGAMRYHGELVIHEGFGDAVEWFSVATIFGRVETTLLLWEGNRASLYLYGSRPRYADRLLYRVEEMLLVDNGPGVVCAFEGTADLMVHEEHVAADLRAAIVRCPRAQR